MRTLRQLIIFRIAVLLVSLTLAWMEVMPAYGAVRIMERQKEDWAATIAKRTYLPPGLTQTPNATLRKKIAAREASKPRLPRPDARALTAREMAHLMGRGEFRNPYFSGSPMPWERAFHDMNVSNGNLFKSFTDVQVAPGRGAGLVLQRTYNSNDSRVGPFGVGWTHAYDIRIQESSNVAAESGGTTSGGASLVQANMAPRTDFFGHKHSYHRDADGLYTPPSYCYDTMNSDYNEALANGPTQVLDDTQKGQDGTIKHFTNVLFNADGSIGSERACDYIQDRYGNTTTLAYNQTITNADGSTRKLLTSVTDPSGRQLTFQWTNLSGSATQPAWRITQVTGPLYNVAYAYYTDTSDPNAADNLYNLQSVTLDPGDGTHLNRTTTYTYTNCQGTDVNNNVVTENALLASITDPLGHVVSYTYATVYTETFDDGGGAEPLSNLPTPTGTVWVHTVTEPAGIIPSGASRTITWELLPDNWTRYVSDQSGMVIECGVDSYGRFTEVDNTKSNGDGSSYGYYQAVYFLSYDNDNNSISCTTEDQSPSIKFQMQNVGPYDPEYAGVDEYHTEYSTYGTHGDQLTDYVATEAGQGGAISVPGTSSTYTNGDTYLQKASMTDENGNTTYTNYYTSGDTNPGNRGQVKFVRDARYSSTYAQYYYTYNSYGQKATETNLNGMVTQYTYGDQWGNLTQVVQDPGGLNRTTTMTYDVAGHVLTSTDPNGNTSTFTYNVLGQPLTVVTATTAAAPGETITYTYDANGRTSSVTDHRGATTIAYEQGSDRVQSVTDPVTGTLSYTYMLTGERASMTLPDDKTWTYAYSDPYYGTYVLPKADPTSATLQLLSITDDQGRIVNYDIDVLGKMFDATSNQVFDQHGGLVSSLLAGTEYYSLPQGSILNYIKPWIAECQSVYKFNQDMGNPASRILANNDYTYDAVGNRLTKTLSVQATNSDGSGQVQTSGPLQGFPVWSSQTTEHYSYDELNRLTGVDYGDGETQSYGFDPMGNRLVKMDATALGTTTTNSTYDLANRLTSVNGASYVNDANGNTLTGGGRTMTWDSQNRMVTCAYSGNTLAFDYGSDGLRRSETLTSGGQSVTTYYVYDGQSLVMEETKNAQGQLIPSASYLNGPRGPEYKKDETTGLVQWYLYDGLGSVIAQVDPSGNVDYSAKYDVYGGVRAASGTATSGQGFVGSLGHLSEAATGLIYMQARYYDPSAGRFVSQDPKGSGNNWFVYCDDNPVNEVDTTGESASILTGTQVALIVGGLTTGYLLALMAFMYIAWGQPGQALLYNAAAVFAFGLAAYGADDNPNQTRIDLLIGGIQAAIPLLASLNASEEAAYTTPVAGTALVVTVAYNLEVLGCCLSIGGDTD